MADSEKLLANVVPEPAVAAATRRPPFVHGVLNTIMLDSESRLDPAKINMLRAGETLNAPAASAIMNALSHTLSVARDTFSLSDHGKELLRQDEVPVIMTGGAAGADTFWAQAAPHGTSVMAISFFDHRISERDIYTNVVRLSRERCKSISHSPEFREAGKILKKSVSKEYTVRLMARNLHLAEKAGTLLAVVKAPPASTYSLHVGVEGGTGWTCQFFAELHKTPGPLDMFCTTPDFVQWYRCHRNSSGDLYWDACGPPAGLTGAIGCVGTRDVTSAVRPRMAEFLDRAIRRDQHLQIGLQ